jgi:hypothetical protein
MHTISHYKFFRSREKYKLKITTPITINPAGDNPTLILPTGESDIEFVGVGRPSVLKIGLSVAEGWGVGVSVGAGAVDVETAVGEGMIMAFSGKVKRRST